MSERYDQVQRVSTLELFFDLVFVFTITQLTAVLVRDRSWAAFAHVTLMLGIIWWMYGGYAWLTNAVAADRASRRLLLLGGMAGFLVLALAIPTAFTGDGIAFGVAYLAVVVIHGGLFTRAAGVTILKVVPFNLAAAVFVIAGGAVEGVLQPVLWSLAFALLWASPRLAAPEAGFDIGPAHFVERHGLVIIVAIGESVVAIGVAARGLAINPALVGVVMLELLLTACLWWIYFGGDDERAEGALACVSGPERHGRAIRAFGLWHLPLLLGIVVLAFGLNGTTRHVFDPVSLAPAVGLAAGTALFLAGDVGFRRSLELGRSTARNAACMLVMVTVPLGTEVAAAAQLAAVVAVLLGALLAEALPLMAATRARREVIRGELG